MAAYDNKILDGAGLAKLIGLIKSSGTVSESEIYIGSSTPSTNQYKVWIDTSGTTDTFVKGVNVNGIPVTLDGNYIANLTGLQPTLTAGDNVTIENNVISATGGGGGAIAEFSGNSIAFAAGATFENSSIVL